MDKPFLAVVALGCAAAALTWGRSARLRYRVVSRVAEIYGESDALDLSRNTFLKDALATLILGVVAVASLLASFTPGDRAHLAFVLVLVPALMVVVYGRNFPRHARLATDRWELERKVEEVLDQENLAPKRWAERLAPVELGDFPGFELGRVYQAGTGLMAGDFYDVFKVGEGRVAAVIGDVTGHGIEPSITAFQAKYLLRVFLRQFRDPAQALEELNAQMSSVESREEFISLGVVVFDMDAQTLRYASAGHPSAWLWHGRDVHPLRATGPLLMLDPVGRYFSKEVPLEEHDLLLLYTDGLAEARDGAELFGEERIANTLRRDPGASPGVLCKDLLGAAQDFSSGKITDDVAILAIRKL